VEGNAVPLSFGDFVFDPDTREVRRAGREVALSPKAFELLDLLVRERPRALSKEKIHAALWPGVFVSDASLTNVVAELRAALGDSAREPRVIRTVHRFGYSFAAKAVEKRDGRAAAEPPDAAFRLLWERHEIALEPGENILGRDQKAVVWVDDPSVSRHHARVVVDGGAATLEDLRSKNGTLVNGRPAEGRVALSDGDEIRIGRAALTVRMLRQGVSTQTASGLPKPKGRRS
jgi:DNA-binding winged helix-turn-helix (wHTH) protein